MRGTDSRHALADRRCERPVVNLQYSHRYSGASPWRHLKTRTAVLNLILCRTGSQWSSCITGVMRSNYGAVIMTKVIARVHPVHLMNVDWAPGGRQSTWAVSTPKIGSYHPHPPSPLLLLFSSGKSGPKDQVALHYHYTSPSHWCMTHEVSKLQISQFRSHYQPAHWWHQPVLRTA